MERAGQAVLMRRSLWAWTLTVAVVLACSRRPAIEMREEAGGVVVDVQSLGEYPTTVKKVRLSNVSTREVVWELNGVSKQPGGPQIAEFRLNAGENPARIEHVLYGSYQVAVPRNGSAFTLQRGVAYELTLWGESGRTSSAKLVLR